MEKVKSRLMGLDYGSLTIGVAISDELGLTAQGVEIIRRQRPSKQRESLRRIEELVLANDIKAIVLGFPKHLNNTEGDRCQRTLEFADMLVMRLGLPLFLWDERLTSVESENVLRELNIKGTDKKKYIDEMAAMLILQNFLDGLNNGVIPEEYISNNG